MEIQVDQLHDLWFGKMEESEGEAMWWGSKEENVGARR
jgi:hypothetical protein